MHEKQRLLFSVRARIVVLFGLLFLLLFGASLALEELGLPVLGLQGELQARRSDAFDHLALIADLKKDRLNAWMQERLSDSDFLVRRKNISSYAQRVALGIQKIGPDKTDKKKLVKLFREDKDFRNVEMEFKDLISSYQNPGFYSDAKIIDGRTGTVIVSFLPEELAMNVVNEAFFNVPLKTGRAFIGASIEQSSHKPVLLISSPLSTGVLALRITTEGIFNVIGATENALGKSGDVVIVDSNATIMAPLRFPLPGGAIAEPLKYRLATKSATLAAKGAEGVEDTLDYRGVRVLTAIRKIKINDETFWGLVVKQDYSEIIWKEYRTIVLRSVLNVLALAIILVASARIAKTISGPIEALGKIAEEVEKGNYSIRADVSGSGEVEVLSGRINSMVEGIAARKASLEIEIAERKKAEAETAALNKELDERVKRRTASLDAANKELEAFAYSVSHDLRAPLRGIDGFSLAILEDYGDKLDEKGKEYLRRIRGGAIKMSELIDDLLKLSRITRQEMRVEEVNLSIIAKSIADELKTREPNRDIEFIIGPTGTVNGDSSLLRVALDNLIGNAWKFTGKTQRAKIEFGQTKVEGEDAIFVKDNGAGFDPRYQNMLFSPFHRLHTDAEFEGIGIGLATVKRVIGRHGGRVWGEGESGKGATFYFII